MIEHGTIGWSTKDDHAFVGNTAENDGYTMLFVTLFRGRDITKPIKDPKVAEGHRITAMMSSALGRIPPKGTRVLVATPDDAADGPGMGMVIAYAERNSASQLATDRAVVDYGDQHLVMKAKSITLMDQANRFICVGQPRSGGAPGLTFQDENGAGGCIQGGHVGWWSTSGGVTKGLVQIGSSGIDMIFKSGSQSSIKWEGGNITISADSTVQLPCGNLILGPPGNPAPSAPLTPLYTAVALGPAGAGVSTIIFASTP